MPGTIYTVGHSTRAIGELIEMLNGAGVGQLVDVRRFPSSRRYPQFDRAALERSTAEAGIAYHFLGDRLGGRVAESVPAERSRNAAWQVAAFRHYADAMAAPPFQAGIAALETLAHEQATAFMCAERLWWSCHRRLIADYLTVRGWSVVHLIDPTTRHPHELPEFARVVDGELSYPALL